MPSRQRSGSCGPSAARGAACVPPTSNSYFLSSFGKLLTPPTTPLLSSKSANCCSRVTSSPECRVKVKGLSRDRRCVIPTTSSAPAGEETPPSSCDSKRHRPPGKCVKTVRFETVQDDNKANEQHQASLRSEDERLSEARSMEPLYATVRKRNNPPEMPQLQRHVDMPQAPSREEGFRPYRSFRQSSSNHHNNLESSHLHSNSSSSRHHHNNHQHTWHVRQNTEIWSSGYKVTIL